MNDCWMNIWRYAVKRLQGWTMSPIRKDGRTWVAWPFGHLECGGCSWRIPNLKNPNISGLEGVSERLLILKGSRIKAQRGKVVGRRTHSKWRAGLRLEPRCPFSYNVPTPASPQVLFWKCTGENGAESRPVVQTSSSEGEENKQHSRAPSWLQPQAWGIPRAEDGQGQTSWRVKRYKKRQAE